MERKIVDVADFSMRLGGRFRKEGKFSGQEFRETVLEPLYDAGHILEIHLDSIVALPPSFADEAFGGLIRSRGAAAKSRMVFVAIGRPARKELAMSRVEKAISEARGAH